MFGYVTVDKSEMLCKDFDAYKAIYCSLCKQLGKEYTFLSRFILSYDCTFYAVLSLALADDCPGFCTGRCKFNPLKKCNYLKSGEDTLSKAAALSVVSVYFKLVDNIADGNIFQKIGCYLLLPLFKSFSKKARKKHPQIYSAVKSMSNAQFEAERDKSCSIDKAAHPTADMLCAVMSDLASTEEQLRIFSNFGYFLGKWIYLCDAAADFDDDVKSGGFNPYTIAFGNDKQSHIDDINESLSHCLSEMYLSYNLIKFNRFESIIDNVLVYGLPKKQRSILYPEHKD